MTGILRFSVLLESQNGQTTCMLLNVDPKNLKCEHALKCIMNALGTIICTINESRYLVAKAKQSFVRFAFGD